jgi:hypothetical protein
MLIGNKAKSVILRELFSAKRNQQLITKRVPGEIHLYINAFSIFNRRPLLIVNSEILFKNFRAKIPFAKCYKIIKQTVQKPSRYYQLNKISSSIYAQLLFPFTNIFYFLLENLNGFKQVVHCLAT